MKYWTSIIAVLSLPLWVGCSICCGPYDYNYPTIGGKHQRVNPSWGRVGSIFSDPLVGATMGPNADSNLKPQPELRSNKTDEELEEFDLRKQEIEDKLDQEMRDLEGMGPAAEEESSGATAQSWRNKLRSGNWR